MIDFSLIWKRFLQHDHDHNVHLIICYLDDHASLGKTETKSHPKSNVSSIDLLTSKP